MKILILYSSVTGNTKFLAEHLVHPEHSVTCLPVEKKPADTDYDLLFLGFWTYRGKPDPRMLKFMQTLNGKNIAVFGTLAAYPHSEHARRLIAFTKELIQKNNTYLGEFLCLGRLTQKRLKEKFSPKNPNGRHPLSEERIQRLLEGQKHPDSDDCANLQEFFMQAVKKAEQNQL